MMHNIDIDLIEMALDITKYTVNRLTQTDPHLGPIKSEEQLKELVGETITAKGIGGDRALQVWKEVLSQNVAPIDHPRNLAFVPASPTRAAVMFDLVTAASSIHGAFWLEGAGGIFAENQAMEWLVQLTGLPKGAFGVFTSGGTTANLSGIVTAREHWRSQNPERNHYKGAIITSGSAHASVRAMAKIIDAEVISIPTEDSLTGKQIEEVITSLSPEERSKLFSVVATGGTTNAGIIDDLESIAGICKKYGLWMHVDAAYGGGALAADSVRHLFNGIEKADSITIDPHKWLFSPYDCGAIIYRNPKLAKKVHKQEGPYLNIFKEADGFNPSDYQIQLTRRVRGLPLWFSLAVHGTDRYKEAIERGIELARLAADKIRQHPHLELVREPGLSCVLFKRIGWEPRDYTEWTFSNLKSGLAFIAPTTWKCNGIPETVARFCFINPDTTETDIDIILKTM